MNFKDLEFYTKTINGTTITNTFSVPDNKISVTVNKMWNDSNNMYGKRPSSIKLQVKNGQTVVQEATVTQSDSWRYMFTDLAKYDNKGNEINYTVDEKEVNSGDLKFYKKEIEDTTITNTFTVPDEKINVTVIKVWNDNNNVNGKRPESIMLQVKNGQMLVEEQEITEANGWKYTFTDLAKYDDRGNEITYTVDEKEVNLGDLKFYTKEINDKTITNTFTIPDEKVNVMVNKVWNDNNNISKKRPESIILQVKNRSTVVAEQTVTEVNGWKYTFTNLPKYDSQGNEILYTVDEEVVNKDDLKFYTKEINGTTITNTFTIPDEKTMLYVIKLWDDNENEKGYRPKSIKIQVKNGNIIMAEEIITEETNWEYLFKDLPKYDEQGNEITYTVDEKEVNSNDLLRYDTVINSEETVQGVKGIAVINTYNYGKVTVKYIDKETNKELDSEEIEGKIGDSYVTKQKEISGYEYVERTENAKGEITKEDIIVTYYYEKKQETVKPDKPALPATGDSYILEIIILVASATAYLVVLALKHKRCK